MSNPQFSVIVPAYNMERYIGECLGSLDHQTCRDFEVVIVDDGSTDGTSRIVDDWVAKNECFHVVHKENEGPLLARCCGVSHSVGTYIVYLDADDCLEPECLEACRRVIAKCSPDIVSFDFFNDRSTRYSIARHDLPRDGLYTNDEMRIVQEVVVGGEYNELCGKAFRRSLFLKDDTDYRTEYHRILLGEDWLQLLPVVAAADSFYYIPKALYYYRYNVTSSTHVYRPQQVDDLYAVLSRVLACADSWGGRCPGISRGAALMQLCGLVRLLADTRDDDMFHKEFQRINLVAQSLGLNPEDTARLSPHNRLLSLAILKSRPARARLLARVANGAKRLAANGRRCE